MIYKICSQKEWTDAVAQGAFKGATIDLRDGYIHFSTASQVRETAAKHFARQDGLLLVGVDETLLGEYLKWEVSRGGDLFPHLYKQLDPAIVSFAVPLPLDVDGTHNFSGIEGFVVD